MPIGQGIGGGRKGRPNFLAAPGRQPCHGDTFLSAPFAHQAQLIVGVTKDRDGIPVAGVTVDLFDDATDKWLDQVVSDGTGNFTFGVGTGYYYLRCYKSGAPDVSGTSANGIRGG